MGPPYSIGNIPKITLQKWIADGVVRKRVEQVICDPEAEANRLTGSQPSEHFPAKRKLWILERLLCCPLLLPILENFIQVSLQLELSICASPSMCMYGDMFRDYPVVWPGPLDGQSIMYKLIRCQISGAYSNAQKWKKTLTDSPDWLLGELFWNPLTTQYSSSFTYSKPKKPVCVCGQWTILVAHLLLTNRCKKKNTFLFYHIHSCVIFDLTLRLSIFAFNFRYANYFNFCVYNYCIPSN